MPFYPAPPDGFDLDQATFFAALEAFDVEWRHGPQGDHHLQRGARSYTVLFVSHQDRVSNLQIVCTLRELGIKVPDFWIEVAKLKNK